MKIDFKKMLVVLVALLMVVSVSATPVLVGTVANATEPSYDSTAALFAESSVKLDIGERQSLSNVRYAEINGVQKEISENDNKYEVLLSEENMLVEITEKTSPESAVAVKTQYFYIDVKNKTAEKLSSLENYMQSYEEKTIRTVGEMGIRFKAHASTTAKYEKNQFVVDEYGYIITTEALLGEKDLTFDSDRYIKGVGFSREKNINIVFDSTNDAYDVFTLVLKNIPVEHYASGVVCKTYTKLTVNGQSFVVYGEKMSGSVYEIAKNLFLKDSSNTNTSKIVFDYVSYAGADPEFFEGAVVSSSVSNGNCVVKGSFGNVSSVETKYNVYLATYNEYGTMLAVKKSGDFKLKAGFNEFDVSFALSSLEKQTKAFVFTSLGEFAGCEEKGNWQITEKSFYDTLASSSFSTAGGYFNPDSNVTVIEAIALISNIHAKYSGKDVLENSAKYERVFEMDDADMLVDLSDRNTVNLDRINLSRATGGIDEAAGYLYGQTEFSDGRTDPQIVINGLDLDARKYNKITIRMKLDNMENDTTNLYSHNLQVYFSPSAEPGLTEAKSLKFLYRNVANVKDWFVVELEAFGNENWQDVIKGVRIDPANCKLKFWIDYVKFSQSDKTTSTSWYDNYLDYAVANNIVTLGQYNSSEYTREITNKEVALMLANAFPESAFPTVNNINAIPDVEKNDKSSDIYLRLYKAGITLGSDAKGNFLADSPIKRSMAASIANRVLVPSKRLRGTVSASWSGEMYAHDREFISNIDLNNLGVRNYKSGTTASLLNGSLVYEGKNDSGFVINNLSIDPKKFTKVRVRFKAENYNPTTDGEKLAEIYFQNDTFSGSWNSYRMVLSADDKYLDPFGWYVFEFDMSQHYNWEGNISYFRFDPMNAPAKYIIDYIRFIKSPYSDLPTQQDLIKAGYIPTDIMPDGFKNGFLVSSGNNTDTFEQMNQKGKKVTFPESTGEPLWTLGCWYNGAGTEEFPLVDAWESRDESKGTYTFADTYGINTITYNPELDSMTQRLNATKIYNGRPHDNTQYSWWPHQLFNINENFTKTVDKEVCSADGDRMFVEMDIRMLDFKNSPLIANSGEKNMNVCSYLAYFYLRVKETPTQKIWFGMCLFSTNGTINNLAALPSVENGWGPDSAAHQFMYGIPQATVYGGMANSFNPSKGVAAVGEEWKKIRLDITPHIDRAVEWANRDNIFGKHVEKSDMYFEGLNIGYEVHGNYDATFEIKNIRMISYNKP